MPLPHSAASCAIGSLRPPAPSDFSYSGFYRAAQERESRVARLQHGYVTVGWEWRRTMQ